MVNRSGSLDTSDDGVFFREYPRFGLVVRRNQECGGQIARADVFCERVLNRVNGEYHRKRVTRRRRYSTQAERLALGWFWWGTLLVGRGSGTFADRSRETRVYRL